MTATKKEQEPQGRAAMEPTTTATASSVTSEAALQAEAFKVEGNALLAAKQFREAVEMYTRAIALDPDNAVYHSNRSAAYLAMGDERGNALRDAETCIALRPQWWKGYSRKGAAEHALQRFDAARETYRRGLELDPDNESLLAASQAAYDAGQEHSRWLREQAKARAKAKEAAEAAAAAAATNDEDKTTLVEEDAVAPGGEDDLLAEFMSEVQELEENVNTVKKAEPAREKPPVDFGTAEGQIVRILQQHYEWINLNPFRVLMLDLDATEEDIKQHYRKISSMVHPDKCRNPHAREAFEQVTKAHDVIMMEDKRKTYIRLIENAHERVDKERRAKLKKGVSLQSLGDRQEELDRAVLKAFAEMEHRRQNLEKREAALRRREAEQHEQEQEKLVKGFKRERTWAEEDRRENRVGNWRTFQKDGKRRKDMDAQGWKEEKRSERLKFGEVDGDEYKKKWK